jgi:hypothetical protein
MRITGTRHRRLAGALTGAIALTGTVVALAGAAPTPQPHAGQRIDMRVLLLANSAGDTDIVAWKDHLRREGVPYDVLAGDTATLTPATLADGDRAKYEGVVVAGADGTNGGRPLNFDAGEWDALHAFEQRFAIRQLDVNAVPGPPLGLNFATSAGRMDGQTATLTAAGKAQFADLQGPVPFDDLSPDVDETYGFSATPCDGVAVPTCNATSFEPVLTSASGAALAGIAQTKDGREELAQTFNGNQFQLHYQLLRHSMLSWVTRGVYLGRNRSFLQVDVDDIFLPDDRWNPALNTTPEGDGTPGQQDLRMTAGDVGRLVSWQNANGVKLNMLFNGGGSDEYVADHGSDPLLTAFNPQRGQFVWMNHTFTHPSLGFPNPDNPQPSTATIRAQISQNVTWARNHALPSFDRTELVTGEHSGIGTSNPVVAPNPNMAAALSAEGIRTIGADSSREVGQRSLGGALTLPRYPMNVFYNVSTWGDQLDEYNWLYLAKGAPGGDGNCTNTATTTCFTQPTSQAQFIDREASAVVRHMLGNDPRPHYAHQTNVMSDAANAAIGSRGDGILFAVLGEAVKRYRAYVKAPFVQGRMTALTDELRRQLAWNDAVDAGRVGGYIQDGKVTITNSGAAIDAPVTGTTAGELYGGQRSGWQAVGAGGSVTLSPSDPRNTAAPALSGPAIQGATLTVSNGTWTGTPTIAYAYQWQRRATATAAWADIPQATTTSYVVTAADTGQQLRAVVAAGNRLSSWSQAATAPTTGLGVVTAPQNTGAPAITGATRVGATLTSSTGTWSGTTPLTFTYQWERSTNGGSTWSAISGATARSYTQRLGDSGDRLRVKVTATNPAGAQTATSGPVGPVRLL